MGYDQFFSGVFFVSFIMVNGIVLINVVVAVLLDKMAASVDEDGDGIPDVMEEEMEEQEAKNQKMQGRKKEIDDLSQEISNLSAYSRKEVQATRAHIDNLNRDIV